MNKTKQLRQQLIDAMDGHLSSESLKRLEMDVKAHDPGLWDDFIWMKQQQSGQGVFSELAGMRSVQPETGALSRLYTRIASQKGTGLEVEEIVWSWFRRYVLSFGLVLIVLLAGLQSGRSGISDAHVADHLESLLGVNSHEIPDLDHWLYEDGVFNE